MPFLEIHVTQLAATQCPNSVPPTIAFDAQHGSWLTDHVEGLPLVAALLAAHLERRCRRVPAKQIEASTDHLALAAMVRAAVLAITSIALAALPASAQSSDSGRPGHGFATVGIVGSSGDPADVGQTVNRGHLLVSGAVFVAPHVGIGIETFPEHDDTSVANYDSFNESDQLQETTAPMVTARGRAFARSHFAIDGVFGVGALRQTRTSTIQARFPPFQTSTATTDNTSAAFSLGADAPIFVVRHVAVIPQMRWYHLRRLANVSGVYGRVLPLSYPSALVAPGSLFALGVTAGVTW